MKKQFIVRRTTVETVIVEAETMAMALELVCQADMGRRAPPILPPLEEPWEYQDTEYEAEEIEEE